MYLNYNIQIITAEPAVRRQGTVARESFLLLSRDKIPNREEERGRRGSMVDDNRTGIESRRINSRRYKYYTSYATAVEIFNATR